jgi:hypothetical protein
MKPMPFPFSYPPMPPPMYPPMHLPMQSPSNPGQQSPTFCGQHEGPLPQIGWPAGREPQMGGGPSPQHPMQSVKWAGPRAVSLK